MWFFTPFCLCLQFIVECHSETLLPQYLGMYRTTIENKEYYYLVIRSVFSDKKSIQKKYDLKVSVLSCRLVLVQVSKNYLFFL